MDAVTFKMYDVTFDQVDERQANMKGLRNDIKVSMNSPCAVLALLLTLYVFDSFPQRAFRLKNIVRQDRQAVPFYGLIVKLANVLID